MGSYRGTPDPQQRITAIAGVAAVHAILAAVILAGLNVRAIRHAVETMTTIDVRQPPPPPPPEPSKPAEQPSRAKLEEGAAGKKSVPAPIVAPKSILPPANSVVAATVAGEGTRSSPGAATSGTATGAGGRGSGAGGGGDGDTSRFTPARLIRNIGRRDYAAIAGSRMPVGSADVALLIGTDGSVTGCSLLRSSGDPAIDRKLCPILGYRLRFYPARNDGGQPIAYRANYHATWRLPY